MGKKTTYAINEYRIDSDRNVVEVKAYVFAKFDNIWRKVYFTGTAPLERLIEYALKQSKLDLATRVRQKAGVTGPEATWKPAAREAYERLWVLAEKNGVDFLNPEPLDPAEKFRAHLEKLLDIQAEFPDANLQQAIASMKAKIRRLEE